MIVNVNRFQTNRRKLECEIENEKRNAKRDALLCELLTDLGFESTEMRGSDSLDFRDMSVGAVKTALRLAFEAGRAAQVEAGKKQSNA